MTTQGTRFRSNAAASLVRRLGAIGEEVSYQPSAGGDPSDILAIIPRKRGSEREYGQGGEDLIQEIEGIFSADPTAEAYGETVGGIAAPVVDDVMTWSGAEFPVVSLEPKDTVQNGWRFVARRRDQRSRSGSGKYVKR